MAKAILLLGSNLGDRRLFLQNAIAEIEIHVGKIMKQSSLYETAPWGKESEHGYLNQATLIDTDFLPHQLLASLQKIERDLGRTRSIRWEDRVIDIDILLYDSVIINSPTLIIPHPEIQNRRFALVPLCEITDDWVHPVFLTSVKNLLQNCKDSGEVILFDTK